jgi:CxxC motif-containing protein (DUF1111 family)
MDAVLGKALFERDWVPAPTSTASSDGLGPLFSARGCAGCHGGPSLAARFIDAPEGRVAGRGLVMRFGDAEGNPDPLYGRVLQNQAVQGMHAEGRIVLTRSDDPSGPLQVAMTLDRGPLDAATRQSVRLAPPIRGRALLDQIDAEAVLALADPEDRDGDGISGQARMIGAAETRKLGRYGWKAGAPHLEDQIADAFAIDLGLSSAERPLPFGDCTEREPDCLGAPTGEGARTDNHEISAEMIGMVAAYVASLGPDRRNQRSIDGPRIFAEAGCAACHAPSLPSTDGGEIAAYTDLLLHDMGKDLDDGVGERGVVSSEWRTAPLIGMAETDRRRYLHDGRAPTIDLAIRVHGGEAEASRALYVALDEAERKALVEFVGGL